jgi:hypothetical protein
MLGCGGSMVVWKDGCRVSVVRLPVSTMLDVQLKYLVTVRLYKALKLGIGKGPRRPDTFVFMSSIFRLAGNTQRRHNRLRGPNTPEGRSAPPRKCRKAAV